MICSASLEKTWILGSFIKSLYFWTKRENKSKQENVALWSPFVKSLKYLKFHCFWFCLYLQSKIEYDRLIASIGKKPPPEAGMKVRWRAGGISLAQRRDFIQQLQSLSGDGGALPLELNPKEFQGFQLALLNKVRLSLFLNNGEKLHEIFFFYNPSFLKTQQRFKIRVSLPLWFDIYLS